ncbi:MAG: alginate lyase family protein [Bacteroidetes bacterium]|nr:MAG: alginate lyase family protein [Bacteroidota bacterium]
MNILRFIQTVRSFQADQIRQKMVYSLAKSKAARALHKYSLAYSSTVFPLSYSQDACIPRSYEPGRFTFLNKALVFDASPPWNDMKFGKLWNLRLNSFEYLLQEDLLKEEGLGLIKDFIKHSSGNRTLFDAYSVSQRILNWTTFFSKHSVSDPALIDFLYRQANYLSGNPEFHLRNNHLLENGFALLRAGVYFQEQKFKKSAAKILAEEFQRQILRDGAHFELSPMYHCILLRRILESIDLLRLRNDPEDTSLISMLEDKAGLMCGWLMNIAFDNGDLPQLNDSGDESHNWFSLFRYADSLGIKCRPKVLGPSGFRKFRNRHFEMLVDINGLTPSVAPGHSHADTFHFILHVFGSPFMVDTGVSTYTQGPERAYERSTQAHNTVAIANKDQSEVYGSFRVGRKASVFNLKESRNSVSASHNGYKLLGALHHRSFEFTDREIIIRDKIDPGAKLPASAFFHVHKNCMLKLKDGKLFSKFVQISFEGARSVQLCDTWISPSFGVRLPAKKVRVDFSGELVTRIALP